MALNHILEKPQKIVDTGIGLLEQELVLPNLVHREGIDQFAGSEDDTVSVVVEGLLPFRKFEHRSGEGHAVGVSPYNDAAAASATVRDKVIYDQYKERKVPITFSGTYYSGVEMTQEQRDFDFGTWTDKILGKQVKAVARGLSHVVADQIITAPYEVTVGNAEGRERAAIFEARRVLNRFNVPQEGRILVVGTDFEAALLGDEKIVFASFAGDSRAETALSEATLGRLAGFRVVVSNEVPSDAAFAMVDSGVALASAAPSVPFSANGATQSFEGYAMRWLQDYDSDHRVDRSSVDTYAGARYIKDNLVGWDEANGREFVSLAEHFVRGVKLSLTDASVYPGATDELNVITGVGSAEGRAYAGQPS